MVCRTAHFVPNRIYPCQKTVPLPQTSDFRIYLCCRLNGPLPAVSFWPGNPPPVPLDWQNCKIMEVLMRELSVYYCPKCGRYGYYQLTRNAVCPTCDIPMTLLDVRYPAFMHLSREERDRLLIRKMLADTPSLPSYLLAFLRSHASAEAAACQSPRFQELEEENRKLNDTVQWMHQTIWNLLQRNKALELELETIRQPAANNDPPGSS